MKGEYSFKNKVYLKNYVKKVKRKDLCKIHQYLKRKTLNSWVGFQKQNYVRGEDLKSECT